MSSPNHKTRKAYRQGELVFIPLTAAELQAMDSGAPRGLFLRFRPLDTDVIREGEATGHRHQVLAGVAAAAMLLTPVAPLPAGLPDMAPVGADDRLLLAESAVQITHPEHRPLRLPKGRYLIVVQREYDEARQRRVLD